MVCPMTQNTAPGSKDISIERRFWFCMFLSRDCAECRNV